MDFRLEHPTPDRYRERWLSLNGVWDFEIDNERSGVAKEYFNRDTLNGKINVPFCPESKLSGVEHTDFMRGVWYKRDIEIPADWAGQRVLLHVGACDCCTSVYVNGKLAGKHNGGYTPFTFDITDFLTDGKGRLTVYAEDETREKSYMSGKQSDRYESYHCYYTRTTGIWQTVWLEAVNKARVEKYRAYPDIESCSVTLATETTEAALGKTLAIKAYFDGRLVGETKTKINSRVSTLGIALSEKHLWDLGEGNLYDLVFTVEDNGTVLDTLNGYFGLREVRLNKDGMYINGRRTFGRFVLDQGFYPDGIYTAPSDEALVFDIKASMSLGFNGARLHQKLFEPRFLYHADRLGYMVFDETANWGLDHTSEMAIYTFLPEWIETIERDISHPSVIGWCPFNETWDDGKTGKRQFQPLIDTVYEVTRAIDPSRIIVGNSGSFPGKTDAHDVHDYEQDPEKFRSYYEKAGEGIVTDQLKRSFPKRQSYDVSLPIFMSEYGAIRWVVGGGDGWGYGKSVEGEEDFFNRLEGLTDVLLENENIFAYCYTQLTDVEQEQNGLLDYHRNFKFAPEKIARILAKKSVLED